MPPRPPVPTVTPPPPVQEGAGVRENPRHPCRFAGAERRHRPFTRLESDFCSCTPYRVGWCRLLEETGTSSRPASVLLFRNM